MKSSTKLVKGHDIVIAYKKGDFIIVPTYQDKNLYAPYGHTKDTPRELLTAGQLVAMGFSPIEYPLWRR